LGLFVGDFFVTAPHSRLARACRASPRFSLAFLKARAVPKAAG
jgi:hypothetical protein